MPPLLLLLTLLPPLLLLLLAENMAEEVLVGELPPVDGVGVILFSYWDHKSPGGAGVGSNVGESKVMLAEVESGEMTSLP